MRLLLDTHVLLWWLANDSRLGAGAREEVARAETALVSTASVWEMSLKRRLGKLDVPGDLAAQLEHHRFNVLPIHLDHALRVGELPPIHRDPFDRMLVAQAQVERLVIASGDGDIGRYDVETLAV